MDKAYLAAQIIGAAFAITGAYIIGNWWTAIGVFLMLWGNNMASTPRKPGKPRVVKDWLGNPHLEE